MNLDNPESKVTAVNGTTSVRRTFLKRATAGAVFASIPGRSAWATVNGSVVASGHGSSVQGGYCVQILSHGYWKNHTSQSDWGVVPTNQTFLGAFGGYPFKTQNPTVTKFTDDNSLLNVMNGTRPNGRNGNEWKGPGNVNVQMVAMYLNAANHGRTLDGQFIYYPTLDSYGGSLATFGAYLYQQASSNPSAFGSQLSQFIDLNHAKEDFVDSSC